MLRRGLDRRELGHPPYLSTIRTSREVARLPLCCHLRLAPVGRQHSSARPANDLNAGRIQEQGLLVSRPIHELPNFQQSNQDHECGELQRTELAAVKPIADTVFSFFRQNCWATAMGRILRKASGMTVPPSLTRHSIVGHDFRFGKELT